MATHHHHHHHHHQQKHLYELLKDDQEPFVLNNYIADVHRRCQLTRTQPKPAKSNLARNACFLSLSNSPDPRKSPLYFPKSPVGKAASSGGSFGRVPSKTASLLLEAAIRVSHKTQGGGGGNNKKKKKSSSSGGKIGSGIFGSLLKRLGNSKKPKKEEVACVDVKVSVKDILRRDLNRGGSGWNNGRAKSDSSPLRRNAVSSGGRESEPSSAVWSSESNESIDLDLECRSSSSGGAGLSDEELEYVTDVVYRDDTQYFCESPFHFVLERSNSSSSASRRTPEFSSPAASPISLKTEGNENNNDVESLKKCQVVQNEGEGEEEEEKEQCSPVSVLDPPFEEEDDDDCDEEEDDHDDEDEREDEDGEGFDMECSFAFVQKAKQELFEKLYRFEKLAELDPVELEKRMLEYDDEEYDSNDVDDEGASECGTADGNNKCTNQLVMDELRKSSIQIPAGDVKRLVSDLIDEEEKQGTGATKRVCKRFEAWNEVESNTIEMMVEHDFNSSHSEWRNKGGQVSDIAMEIELAIFDLLAEELM